MVLFILIPNVLCLSLGLILQLEQLIMETSLLCLSPLIVHFSERFGNQKRCQVLLLILREFHRDKSFAICHVLKSKGNFLANQTLSD